MKTRSKVGLGVLMSIGALLILGMTGVYLEPNGAQSQNIGDIGADSPNVVESITYGDKRLSITTAYPIESFATGKMIMKDPMNESDYMSLGAFEKYTISDDGLILTIYDDSTLLMVGIGIGSYMHGQDSPSLLLRSGAITTVEGKISSGSIPVELQHQ